MLNKKEISLEKLLKKELVFLNLKERDFSAAVALIGGKMHELGAVKSSYVDAVQEREKKLPTGLFLGDYGVSIPHTDCGHVNYSAVSIATFQHEIEVRSMIEPEKSIQTRLMFLMAIQDPNGQIQMLKDLMKLFKNVEVLKKLQVSENREEFFALIKKNA